MLITVSLTNTITGVLAALVPREEHFAEGGSAEFLDDAIAAR